VRDGVVDTQVVNGLTLITLAGELDLSVVPALRRGLAKASAASRPDLAIDIRRVNFMDCSIIGVLIRAHRTVTAAGGCLRLIGPQPGPAKLIRLCQLDGVLCVHDAMTAATADCTRHATPTPAP
jgi:stage II sporulation protein AA (anti-sigma F factor antagonist)